MSRKYNRVTPDKAVQIAFEAEDLGLTCKQQEQIHGHDAAYISRIRTLHVLPNVKRPRVFGKRLRLPQRAAAELYRDLHVTKNVLGKRISAEAIAQKLGVDAATLKTRVLDRMLDLISRFWSLVQRTTDDSCWIWKGPLLMRSTPREQWPGRFAESANKNHRPHRFSFELLHGPIPPGKVLVHTEPLDPLCEGNRFLCVNPRHFVLARPAGRRHRSPEALRK